MFLFNGKFFLFRNAVGRHGNIDSPGFWRSSSAPSPLLGGFATRFHGSMEILPDLAPGKPRASGPTWVNRCGTIVGSSSSPMPTRGNPVPAIWTKATCD